MDSSNRGLDLEKELTCSICTEVLYQPLTLLDCLHTFCGACLKEWFSWQLTASRNNPNTTPAGSTPYTCPSCRATVRETKHNATVTTLLDMFLAANPDKSRTAEDKESLKVKYSPGEDVMPKVEQREKTLRERRVEDEDRRLMNEVRDLSLRQVGVGPAEARTTRRRRDEDRLQITAPQSSRERSRESRSADGREHRRRTEGVSERDTRRRREEPTEPRPNLTPGEDRHPRRSHEDTRRGNEQTSRTAARQIEHQSSLRSLISSSDVDSHEMEEEILRQIQEEGLLDGIDLEHIDVSQEDQISERIADAFRRRQRERSRTAPVRSADVSSVARPRQSESRDRSGNEGLRASSQHRTHSRSTSATSQADENSRSMPHTSSTHLGIQPNNENRRRRRTTSGNRSATSPVPATSSEAARPTTRSQTDLSDRPRSSQSQSERQQDSPRVGTVIDSGLPRPARMPTESPVAEGSQNVTAQISSARPTVRVRESTTPAGLPVTTHRTGPPAPISVPAPVSLGGPPYPSEDSNLVPAPLSPRHHKSPSASDRASLIQSATRPTSSSTSPRAQLPRFPEPSLTCARCTKTHIEYELHYNCSECRNGDWNMCLSCYRTGRGCLHWFGFGYAAWAKWEKLKSSGDPQATIERPHMLFANRYLPPKITPGGADGRRTITSEDPRKRLQGGAFCANCLAWANECYWRCDLCNEGDWGFCQNCVNQGKCCTHPLLPLLFKPDEDGSPPLSPTLDQKTPLSATILTGPGVIEFGRFKPLTFRISCDICRYVIQPLASRYHCFSCTSTIPGRQPGDYDICTKCYHSLETKKRISPENGHNGWRRCLQGHRTVIVRFEDNHGGQRRLIEHDLIGGRALHTGPSKTTEYPTLDLQQWSWAEGSQERLVSTDVSGTAPTVAKDLKLTTTFPPEGGTGMTAAVMWSWYPSEGDGDNELLIPRGAELRECVDVNGDWFWGVYMGNKGLFPAPYVRVLDHRLPPPPAVAGSAAVGVA